ncbi:hypothetical protein ACWEV3_34060 [Saccharopolyspora sp. NPDC003752]
MAYSHGEYLRGEAEVAVPILGADRRIVAGLSVAGPVDSMNLDAIRMEASHRAASKLCFSMSGVVRRGG